MRKRFIKKSGTLKDRRDETEQQKDATQSERQGGTGQMVRSGIRSC